jgi:hypothetical protein
MEPEAVKVGEDDPKGSSIANESCNVLHDDVAGSYSAYNCREVGPHPSFVVDAELESFFGERLAGEPTADEIDGRSNSAGPPSSCGADVIVARHLRPVLLEHLAAVGVDLDLPDNGHAGAFEAKLEAADAGEERQDVHAAPAVSCSATR